jgi:glycosyltransferase involved in cell wall biosynthesis
MHVTIVTDNFPPESNAPATRQYEHARHWVRAGQRVTVITCAPNFPEGKVYPGYSNRWREVEEIDGIRVVRVKTFMAENKGTLLRTLDYASFMAASVAGGVLEAKPDVVLASSPQFFAAVGGWQLARLQRSPFVFEVRDLWPASIVAVGAMRQSPMIRALERLELHLYDRASAVVVVTEAFREDIVRRGVPAHKLHVVPNGVDVETVGGERDADLCREHRLDGKFVVGYVGTHGMAHGLDRVLDAAELLRDQRDIVFILAGGGAERARLEERVTRDGLANVRMIPRQPRERVPALLRACDLTLIPLRNEPVFATVVPSKLFEAMAYGVPVLMSVPDGEATALLRAAGCGECLPPEHPLALAAAVRRLRAAPEVLAEYRARGLAAAPEHSRRKQAERLMGILEGVVGDGLPGARTSPTRAAPTGP